MRSAMNLAYQSAQFSSRTHIEVRRVMSGGI